MTIVAVLLVLLATAQDNARLLGTGDFDAREVALARILAIPPAERNADVWRALRKEVDRIVACRDVRKPSAAESARLQCDVGSETGTESEYLPNLVIGLSQTRDPSMIPTLIKIAPSGAIAMTGLARFGELAVPALIEAVQLARSGPWLDESSGAMFTLTRMLEQPVADQIQPLSDASRRRITDLANTLLHTKLTSANQIGVVALVLATKDATLRSEVEALATDASIWRAKGVTEQEIMRVQNSIRAQLSVHQKQ